jgi:carboxylate-amine ligase
VTKTPLHLFEGYGVELEYMIADLENLNIKPFADKVINQAAGETANVVEMGPIAWSNELVMHVLEMKTNGPARSLQGLSDQFHRSIHQANTLLKNFQCVLLPTAMHPWMNPEKETRIWSHEQNEVYLAYDRIFGCKGHGWSNLQSTHLNLPFADDAEFTRLHAAIRLILPIIPALTASSPLMDGVLTGLKDNRLEVYRHNQHKIPSLTGRVVPEVIHSIDEYHEKILQRIYKDIAPWDYDDILQGEWLNSRGAIARFDRNAIEIRVIDIQESPAADIAFIALIAEIVKALTEERWVSIETLHKFSEQRLEILMLRGIKSAEEALIDDEEFLEVFGLGNYRQLLAGVLWSKLAQELITDDEFNPLTNAALNCYLKQGSLSSRIMKALGQNPVKSRIEAVYRELYQCLGNNTIFNLNDI